MSHSPQTLIIVVWQSLVVDSYRSFFYKLAEISQTKIVMVSPQRFKELGSQQIDAAPFRSTDSCRGVILPVWSPHTQIVWYRGLFGIFRKYALESHYEHIVVLNLAEPYSITSLICWIQARIGLGQRAIFCSFGLQNIFKKFSFGIALIQKFIFSRCDFILSLGAEQSEVLRQHGFRGEILSFPLWFDSSRFSLSRFGHSQMPNSESPLRVGFIGSLLPEKGVLDILDAFELMKGSVRHSYHLKIAGRGSLQDTVRSRCQELKNRGVECQFLGPLGAMDVPSFFSELDILIVPSRTAPNWKEQFGRVIIEAMACGCSVIGSDSGEIPNVIGRSDHIFKEANPSDLLRVLNFVAEKIRAEPDRFKIRSANAERAKKFSDQDLAGTFFQSLTHLMGNMSR